SVILGVYHVTGSRYGEPPNRSPHQPAAAMLVSRGFNALSAAAAAELCRSAAEGHHAEIVFGILTNNLTKGADDAEHRPLSPRAACDPREDLPGVPRRRRDGQMASAERVHGQGSPPGRQGWRYLQDVVHEFQHRPQPLLRRRISRTGATRTHSPHRQVRRPEPP